MKALIIAGGAIEDISSVGKMLAGYDIVLCADGGLRHANQLGIVPDITVGDFDSWTGPLPENTEIHRSVPEKDDTDTMLAVKLALERGCTEIVLIGGLGGRFDHTMANLQTMIFAHEHGCKIEMLDGRNVLYIQGGGEVRYPLWENWYFSVFALSSQLEIERMSGVKYPLESFTLTPAFPLGVSNEITASEAVLSIRSGLALVVRSHK